MYSLSWNTYSDHLRGLMKELMMNEDFADVTLVTEDKKQIKANIHILSACSPVFKDILKKEKTNQIMYLRGIQFPELESIMQYIYLGEATIHKERMDEFLAVAKSLEIKELCNAGPEKKDGQVDADELVPCNLVTPTENVEDPTVLSGQIINQAPKEREVVGQKPFYHKGSLKNHQHSDHEAVKYPCYQCDYQTTQKHHLTRHIQSQHEGIKYACDQCHYQATQQEYLKAHIQTKHEGVRYACDLCEFQAVAHQTLKIHIQNVHEGIKYACDQCAQQFTTQGHLKTHIRNKHEGVKYACDQCEYQATQKSNLKTHIKKMHLI